MSALNQSMLSDSHPLIVDHINESDSFLSLARKFGEPLKLADGNYIKNLRVIDKIESRPNTLSSKYGIGGFPFHTDGAFMLPPPRWVLLRAVSGNVSRSTYIKPFVKFFEGIDCQILRCSIWACNTGTQSYFTTIQFSAGGLSGYRYDRDCMRAANQSAKTIEETLFRRSECLPDQVFEWELNRVIAIPNWNYLHSRGESPMSSDSDRVLQRIYVK